MRVSLKGSLVLLAATVLLSACERPPAQSKQWGFRGTGMVQISNPRSVEEAAPLHVAPEAPAPASPDGPRAKAVYQNVQVLGDLSVGEFNRTMVAITSWVAPKEGCAYCHNVANFGEDSKYTKVVARKMVTMTQHLNVDWKQHVAATGVTCYTCHRGNNIPAQVWFQPDPNKKEMLLVGDDAGQNKASKVVGLSSLPYDPFSPYLLNNEAISQIRVNGTQPLPYGNRSSTKQAEHTYSLMVHMSKSLGVNCTFCHNTHSFAAWDGPPQRVTAYYGIRMAGELNQNHMKPLTSTFPAWRLGPGGDVAKVNCSTCHQGVNKPLNGAAMAKDFPALLSKAAPAADAASAAMPVASPASDAAKPTVAAAKLGGPLADSGVRSVAVR
jgi:photosynthetic reaction center cytochrome c subunit